MRILIFGVNGMLGHKLYQCLKPHFEVFGTLRSDHNCIKHIGFFDEKDIIENVEAFDVDAIRNAIDSVRPDCVINAIGVIKQRPTSKDVIQTLTLNSIFPHRLSELSREFGFRLITLSTDCVFDGVRGNYAENDAPDARDLYGLSKQLGEIDTENSLTIRTSIIGRELQTGHSIVEWFLKHRGGRLNGYKNAIYSGFPTIVLSRVITDLIRDHRELNGIWHISSDPISKFDLLHLINKHFEAGVEIDGINEPRIDRSLNSERYRSAVGFQPESWERMISEMAADSAEYDIWRAERRSA